MSENDQRIYDLGVQLMEAGMVLRMATATGIEVTGRLREAAEQRIELISDQILALSEPPSDPR